MVVGSGDGASIIKSGDPALDVGCLFVNTRRSRLDNMALGIGMLFHGVLVVWRSPAVRLKVLLGSHPRSLSKGERDGA